MIDKGEKIPAKEKKEIRRRNFSDFKKGLRKGLHNKKSLIPQILIIVLVAGVFIQSGSMISKMNKLLGESETTVHEIYDDSAVIKAYKTGDTSKLNEKDLFVHDKMSEVIKEIIKDDMTNYEKEKAVYDWLFKWTTYNSESLNPIVAGQNETHTPYGVLRSHNAICVGDATTFKLFMDALDIPCVIIHSTESGEHAWDVVQLDGEWYHVDVMFDGGSNGKPGYSYFNVPDTIKDDGSYPWDHNEIPAANGTKYCYMYTNAQRVDTFYDIPKGLKKAINNGKSMATFILKDKNGFNRQIAEYIGNAFSVENGYVGFGDAYSLNGEVVYKYTIESYDNSGSQSIPDDVLSKLEQVIAEANGIDGDSMGNMTSDMGDGMDDGMDNGMDDMSSSSDTQDIDAASDQQMYVEELIAAHCR